jgi:hypothetical protein
MTLHERLTFERNLEALADVFGVRLTDGRRDGYWEALADLGYEAVEAAMSRAKQRAQRFPVPAQIRELAQSLASEERGREMAHAAAQAAAAGELPQEGPHCSACDDTGWIRSLYKPAIYGGVEVSRVRRCHCWSTNPVRIARNTW